MKLRRITGRLTPAAVLGLALATACSGEDGAIGPQGPAGQKGADGMDGMDGMNGTNGRDGMNGMDGMNGRDGMNGTNGSTGAPGMTGPRGPSGLEVFNVHAELPEILNVSLVSLDIGTPTRAPVVTFRVTDGIGRGAVGLRGGTSGHFRYAIAKLTPAVPGNDPNLPNSGNPSYWTNYIKSNGRPTTERAGRLVDNQDGTYQYTFTTTVAANAGYDASLTHRLTIQLSGTLSGETNLTPVGAAPPANFTHDFVPAGGAVTNARDIVDEASCNGCHGKLTLHGSRFETKYCVMCHNPDLVDANGNSADMKVFIHKIHYSSNLPTVRAGRPYMLAGEDYSETTLPLDARNCRKCHNGEPNAAHRTAQGNNWKEFPSREACGACHDNIDWAATPPGPTAHFGGPMADNRLCTVCHGVTSGLAPIETLHLTDNATPNNPNIPAGLSKFSYEIRSATVDATGHPIVAFRILRDTGSGPTPLDLTGTALPTTPVTTGGPSFLLAYALPQPGNPSPSEYNQLGRSAAQPLSVSLANLRAGTAGTVTATSGGFFLATFTGANAFPPGATLRAVALQGYFSENLASDNPDRGAIGRHTPSVIAAVRGDPARRVVVDSAKCASCHEFLEGHGGNRVANVQVCVVCHNPNLSSSGRGADPVLLANQANNVGNPSAEAREAAIDTLASHGPDPRLYPEAPNNMKDLIHGLHGGRSRSNPFEFVRDRGNSGIYSYDWSEVTFPNIDGNCAACHLPNTYRVAVTDDALPSTERTTTSTGVEQRAQVLAARAGVPNLTDVVTSPQAASCTGCHDNPLALAHMRQNGGAVRTTRAAFANAGELETCDLCHGTGRVADVQLVHPILR